MASRPGKQRFLGLGPVLWAYAELGRISNLPTCVSNVLVGVTLGTVGHPGERPDPIVAVWLSVATCLLYVGGTALNDVVDLTTDLRERPGRPIPSGRISLAAAVVVVAVCFLAGLVIVAFFGPPTTLLALALIASIVAYDLLHKRVALSVFLMGACRGLVYLVGAAAVGWPLRWAAAGPLAATLALYVVGITLVARAEVRRDLDVRRWLAVVMLGLVVLPAAWFHPSRQVWSVVTMTLLVVWLAQALRAVFARPPRTVQAVLTWLSGICLVDAFFLSLLDRPEWGACAVACFLITAWGHRQVLGT